MIKADVIVDGDRYPMIGDESEQRLRTVAKIVDDEIFKVKEQNPTLSKIVRTVVASLNIADELYQCLSDYEKLDHENKELKLKEGKPNLELNDAIEKLRLELKSKDDKILEMSAQIKEIKEINSQKETQIEELSSIKNGNNIEIDAFKAMIEELQLKVQEAEESVRAAEKVSSTFQNKTYVMQLKYTELEQELKFLRATK